MEKKSNKNINMKNRFICLCANEIEFKFNFETNI